MNTTSSPTLGQRLQAARLAKGWSVERLAAETGLTVMRIEDCEASTVPPIKAYISLLSVLRDVERIAMALGVNLASLFEEVET